MSRRYLLDTGPAFDFANLKQRGRIIQQIDMQFAAIALTLGDCTVVSGDLDLREVKNLAVENWAE